LSKAERKLAVINLIAIGVTCLVVDDDDDDDDDDMMMIMMISLIK